MKQYRVFLTKFKMNILFVIAFNSPCVSIRAFHAPIKMNCESICVGVSFFNRKSTTTRRYDENNEDDDNGGDDNDEKRI